jgi:hypothetical protein
MRRVSSSPRDVWPSVTFRVGRVLKWDLGLKQIAWCGADSPSQVHN